MIYFLLVEHLKMVSLTGYQSRLEKDILLPYHNYNHYRYYKYSRSSELIALKSQAIVLVYLLVKNSNKSIEDSSKQR